jgi:MFS family permease
MPDGTEAKNKELIARLDGLSVWSLSYLFVGIIGTGFLFTFFDIYDINVTFVQSCTQIMDGCTPKTASDYIGLPVLINLVGYIIGALCLSPIGDRLGRRDTLIVTMAITGLGSLYTALSPDYVNFVASRGLTGLGIGADLALVNTYINEVAPPNGRVKYTALIFIFSTLGALVAVWLGLLLSTPAAPIPQGLPVALASDSFTYGWRIMYGLGALLALVSTILRLELPESPRWLIWRGRRDEAETVIKGMEERALESGQQTETVTSDSEARAINAVSSRTKYGDLFFNATYRTRTVTLFLMWGFGYITVYSLAAGLSTVLTGMGYSHPEAGFITAVGVLGFVFCALFSYRFGESLERKRWLPVASVFSIVGVLLMYWGGSGGIWVTVIGAVVLFFGFNVWVPIAYSWTTENYPTALRASGFGTVDGIGHVGGGIGFMFIAPLTLQLDLLPALFLLIAGQLVCTVIAQFGMSTRHRKLENIQS